MNSDQINSLMDVLERSKEILAEQNCSYCVELIEKINIELIILKAMKLGAISPIRDFLCRLRAEKDEEPFTTHLNWVKRALILEYLTEQIEEVTE